MFNMKNKNIFQWGPPVFKYELKEEEFNILKTIKPDIRFTQGKNGKFNGVEQINYRLGYSKNKAEEVISILDGYFQDYIQTILNKNIDYIMNGLWVNIYGPNYYIAPHVHTDCDLSFIVYIKSNQELIDKDDNSKAGYTIFHYGIPQDSRTIVPTITTIDHRPKDKELIIFPNNLNHHVVPYSIKDIERITLSGNIGLKI